MRKLVFLLFLVLMNCSFVESGQFDFVQPGTWYEIPASALNLSASYPPSPTPSGSPSAIMTAWGGGLYDPVRNRLLVHGGGHGDYAGNEWYAFSFNTLGWTRLWGPTANNFIPSQPATAGETYGDGNPRSVHSYDGLVYLPAQDRYFRTGGSLWSGGGDGSRAAWVMNPTGAGWTSLGSWSRVGVSIAADWDAARGLVWTIADVNGSGALSKYNPASNSWSNVDQYFGAMEEGILTIDPDRDVGVYAGNGKLYSINLVNGQVTQRATSGPQVVQGGRGPGLAWNSSLRKLVGWFGGTSVYSLDTITWTWTQHAPSGSNIVNPPTVSNSRILGGFPLSKWVYIPAEDVFAVVNTTSSPVYIYRMAGGSNPPPADTTPPSVAISGWTVTGTITLNATASDNVGVAGVTFKVDGAAIGIEDTSAPYSVQWNTFTVTNGNHCVTATARDAAGNVSTSPCTTFIVAN